MKRRTQQTIAAFAVTGIVIAALCGFVAVDLSTDRYMPGRFAPIFEVSDVSDTGLSVALFGVRYRVEPGLLDPAKEFVWRFRGLLPDSVMVAAHATVRGYATAREYLEASQPPEEPW